MYTMCTQTTNELSCCMCTGTRYLYVCSYDVCMMIHYFNVRLAPVLALPGYACTVLSIQYANRLSCRKVESKGPVGIRCDLGSLHSSGATSIPSSGSSQTDSPETSSTKKVDPSSVSSLENLRLWVLAPTSISSEPSDLIALSAFLLARRLRC